MVYVNGGKLPCTEQYVSLCQSDTVYSRISSFKIETEMLTNYNWKTGNPILLSCAILI